MLRDKALAAAPYIALIIFYTYLDEGLPKALGLLKDPHHNAATHQEEQLCLLSHEEDREMSTQEKDIKECTLRERTYPARLQLLVRYVASVGILQPTIQLPYLRDYGSHYHELPEASRGLSLSKGRATS